MSEEDVNRRVELTRYNKDLLEQINETSVPQHIKELVRQLTMDVFRVEMNKEKILLEDFHKKWKERIYNIGNESKEKIIKTAENIPVKVEAESDGSRLIEFELWNKTYKILNPNLNNYTYEIFRDTSNYNSITHINHTCVKLWWMRWNNVDQWDNKKLADYVKQKEKQWLHIPKREEMEILLSELWKKAGLDTEEDQIAMLMYLTWMDWCYRLSMWDGRIESRSVLECYDIYRSLWCSRHVLTNANLCMIACE